MTTQTRTRASGSTRRRLRAIARRAFVTTADVRHSITQDRIPRSAIAVSVCGCGRRSWLLEGASDEDYTEFAQENADHGDWCDGGEAS